MARSTDEDRALSPQETVRAAFGAFARNDRDEIAQLIARSFVWVFFDPFDDAPTLRTCSGRSQIARRMKNFPASGWELVEIASFGPRVAVTTRSPVDRMRPPWRASDENFHVVEVHDGRVVALRACHDWDEAVRLARTESESLSI